MKGDRTIEEQYRRFLLAAAGLVFVVTPLELLLAEHYESLVQWSPLALCVAGLGAVAVALLRPSRTAILGLRGVVLVMVLGSLFGVYEHVEHNIAFEREIRPAADLSVVVWEGLFGASPPLAPGILAFGALLALAATYRHPHLVKTNTFS